MKKYVMLALLINYQSCTFSGPQVHEFFSEAGRLIKNMAIAGVSSFLVGYALLRLQHTYLNKDERTYEQLAEHKTFASFAGTIPLAVRQLVDFIKNPNKFAAIGARLPKAILFTGAPGNGKTLLAQIVAGEAQVPFFYASASSFDSIWIGSGPKAIRELFASASRVSKALKKPVIIFIDEIDAIGRIRTADMQSADLKTLNELLTHMDGVLRDENIIVIAATNNSNILDAALMRRFDNVIVIPNPDCASRKAILAQCLSECALDDSVSAIMDDMAQVMEGFSADDIKTMVNRAAIQAAYQEKSSIDAACMIQALQEAVMRKYQGISFDDRSQTEAVAQDVSA